MKILLDNGHGVNTPGKCSPDRRLLEYKWVREIAERIEHALRLRGHDVTRIVTEDIDIPLSQRVARVNHLCPRADSGFLVSVHVNAAGADARWHKARGWSAWVCRNASASSRKLASMLHDEAKARHLLGNRAPQPYGYWEADFYILRNTRCPAVLTENLFQDNEEDVAYLLSEAGKREITDLHVAAIERFVTDHNRKNP